MLLSVFPYLPLPHPFRVALLKVLDPVIEMKGKSGADVN